MALVLFNPKPEGYLFAAYRPMVMQTYLDYPAFTPVPAYPPVVFCDIYLNNIYYKTLSSTVYSIETVSSFGSSVLQRAVWTFDIADSAQEYLRSLPPALTDYTFAADPASVATVRVAFRGSTIDSNGFIQPAGPVPVQGNFSTAPVSGGGLFTPYYAVINATLQHEDNQTLSTHLQYYMMPGYSGIISIFGLTHRLDLQYFNGLSQYDHWPVHVTYRGLDGSNVGLDCIMKIYWIDRQGVPHDTYVLDAFSFPAAPMNYYLPTGIPQLSNLDWDAPPIWEEIVQYQIFLTDTEGNDFFSTTRILCKGCTCDDGARIHFLNSLGGYDAVNFCEREETMTTKSSSWQKSLPLLGLQKRDHGYQRFNVRAVSSSTVRTNAYSESAQEWLEELSRSPRAYLEWKGSQGQPHDLVPVKIADGKVITRKVSGRYEYMLEVTYEMANEKIVQRG